MATPPGDLTLAQLLDRALAAAARVTAADAPNAPAVQALLHAALADLTLAAALVAHLGLLSPNETLDDLPTRDLRCLLLDALRAELALLAQTTRGRDRITWLERAQLHFRAYIALVDRYEVVPETARAVFAGPQHATHDPARRRESKIAQFKMERDIKAKLAELRRRRAARRPRATTAPAEAQDDDDDPAYASDDDDAEIARPLFVNLILLHYLRAHSELASIDQELELLRTGIAMSDLPSPHERRGREAPRAPDDDPTWRVDRLTDPSSSGPLLDSQGKILRPFTILPSTTSSPLATRLRLQSEVFRSGHRLPTMTIDEFLDQERANGNVLQGGGPASSAAVDQERADRLADTEDDSAAGYSREEAGLAKVRDWDAWKDDHRKGEGNMHNRG